MRPMNEIEIELPQIVLDRADAAYAQIRQQAAQESPAGRRVKSFPRVAGILLAVVILSATAVSAATISKCPNSSVPMSVMRSAMYLR